MKKWMPVLGIAVLSMTACQKMESNEVAADEIAMPAQRVCAADEVLQEQLAANPLLKANMEQIERFTAEFAAKQAKGQVQLATVEIPVVVNVLWRTAAENISDAQIQSQIDVLNEDFNAANADFTKPLPAGYSDLLKANVGVHFTLVKTVRKQTTKSSWRADDSMKKSAKGGIDPTSPSNTLNLWACTLGNSLLGYAQFPGGALATDGVVILNKAFGRVGTAAAPYGLGRTATHEVGHWMNLRHIWGDATCGNDQVGDTPLHNTSNGGCPSISHASTCTGAPLELWMNYMDYTYDACMYMFTQGQKSRMLAVFAAGGPRAAFAGL